MLVDTVARIKANNNIEQEKMTTAVYEHNIQQMQM